MQSLALPFKIQLPKFECQAVPLPICSNLGTVAMAIVPKFELYFGCRRCSNKSLSGRRRSVECIQFYPPDFNAILNPARKPLDYLTEQQSAFFSRIQKKFYLRIFCLKFVTNTVCLSARFNDFGVELISLLRLTIKLQRFLNKVTLFHAMF